jgi:hypothetical protein
VVLRDKPFGRSLSLRLIRLRRRSGSKATHAGLQGCSFNSPGLAASARFSGCATCRFVPSLPVHAQGENSFS